MTVPLTSGDPTWVGPYEVLARLGIGGMGVVYLGRSPGGRLVAVKLVRPELSADTGFRRRFSDEVTAARKVGGFYTAQVVDADPDGDPAWLATAYIPGLSLQQAVNEHGPLPWASAAMLGAGLAEGLAAVHAQDLVHRDLKPANVILAPDGPRLIDFGIARALDATSYTQTHTVLGTAPFMSPEQATGDAEIGPAGDIFSLGCVLGFATTGRSPFGDGAWHAIGYRIVHNDPDLAELTELSPQLADLVKRCLAKAPESRPALDAVLHELAVLARGQQTGQQTGPQAQWLPDDLTATIAQRATEVLHGTSVLPDQESDRTVPPAYEQPPQGSQSSGTQDAQSESAQSEGVPTPRGPGRPRFSWPVSPPTGRARVSAWISLGLLAFALLGLLLPEGRQNLAGFLGAAISLRPPALLGSLCCTASAFLNVRHLRWLAQPAVDRYGQVTGTLIGVTGAVIGFLTPVSAFHGLSGLLLAALAPPSDRGVAIFAGLTVGLGLLVALVLRPRRHEYAGNESGPPPQPAWPVSPPTGRARVSAWISLGLLAFALLGLPSAETQEQLGFFVDAATELAPPAVFGPLFGAVSAFLNTRHLRWLAQPAVDRYGQATGTLIRTTGGLVGFLTPIPAFYGLAGLLLTLFDPPSDDGVYTFAGLTVVLGLLIATALRPRLQEFGEPRPRPAWPVTPPNGAALVSAWISLGLLLFGLLGLYSAEGRANLAGFLGAALGLAPSAVLGCVVCGFCAFLNVRHLRWLARPAVDRYGRATGTLIGIAGAVIGFPTPVLAFYGLANVLLASFDPASDDGGYTVAGMLVVGSLLVAIALRPRPDGRGAADQPWQAYASGLISAILLLLALHGLDIATVDGSSVFEGIGEAAENFDGAPDIAILLMFAECVAGLYLYAQQAQQLMRPRAHQLGSTLTTALTVVAGAIGLLVPFLAFGGQAALLDWLDLDMGAPNWMAGASIAIMLALGIGWQWEGQKSR